MHFSRTLLNLVALTIALSCSGQAFANQATTPVTPPADPITGAPICSTVDVVVKAILGEHPEADIKEVNGEDNTVTFTSEKQPADLVAHFDPNGCLVGFTEKAKGTGA